ncbi:MAG: WD40 repeat domain-containing protein [Halieaceae bacterium]|jgi:hypothetical protein|nr:WD40 repeat domain-containing protein [Halieaceae bacterium]
MSQNHSLRSAIIALLPYFLIPALLMPEWASGAAAGPQGPTTAEPAAAGLVPEGTDVWLLDLERDGAELRAGNPRNLTQRPGYDNQPFFTAEGDLMFVVMEGEKTDIWRWDSDSEVAVRLTDTPEEGEFSPTPIPGSGGGISYIRSRTDTSGRLWRTPPGGEAEVIFPDIGPVGYHAWFDDGHVALWLLQEPSKLQVVALATQERKTIATNVGRSPQSVPQRRAVSYTQLAGADPAIKAYDLDLERNEMLARLPEGGDFHAWTPDGTLLASAGSRVFAWRDDQWHALVDLAHLGLRLSRLAVSPDGSRLAVVAEPAG